jgi:pimeloyl-ACP methyl ester carboxylesterase
MTTRLRLANGAEVAIRHAGGGALPVVMLHGYSMSLEVWERVLDRVPAAWTAHAYDLRGFGASSRASGYSIAAHVADLAAVLEALGLARAVLVGHSMGGNILQDFAAAHPHRVAALVLSDVAARNAPPPDPVAGDVARRVSSYGTTEVNRDILRARMPAYFAPGGVSDAVLDRFAALGARADPAALRDMLTASYSGAPIAAAELGRIEAPVLMVFGALDRVTPPDNGSALLQVIPHARLRLIEGAGHTPMWECPEEWLACVDDFLRSSLG